MVDLLHSKHKKRLTVLPPGAEAEKDECRYERLLLGHSSKCRERAYMKKMEQSGQKLQLSSRIIKPACCVALVTADNKVLLTKRHSRLIFPNAWVLPGGHLDPGEDIEQCAIRELSEETGAKVEVSSLAPFMLFESANQMDEWEGGPPKGGHLIVFFLARSPLRADEIELTL